MSRSVATQDEPVADKKCLSTQERRGGLIAFCETNLRYEKGYKAWIFLGPYLLGALILERSIDRGDAASMSAGHAGLWLGFLGYLIFFPPIWRQTLKLVASKKAAAPENDSSSA
jgi:hypothetical protein